MEGERIKPEGRCSSCTHPGTRHFYTEDEIGYYAFCLVNDCPCFIDIRDENGTQKAL